MANYLGLDIGTSSIKAVLLDSDLGKIISTAAIKTPLRLLESGQAEHRPQDLVSAVYVCIKQAVGDYPVAGLGISSFAEAGLPLDLNGQPLYPIIAWYDQRSEPQVDCFLQKIPEEEIIQITGQIPGFSFGLFKWLWINEHYPEIAMKTKTWLSVPDYLIYEMTGNKVTDYTQASRTMMFDQNILDWSERILDQAFLNKEMLPKAVPSGTIVGESSRDIANKTGLPMGTPCCVGGHDHLCGAYASGGHDTERLVDSSGSSQAVIALVEGYDPKSECFSYGFVHYHHVLPKYYLIKGGLKAVGKAFNWLKQFLNFDSLPPISDILDDRLRRLSSFPIVLPFFMGSGTPNRAPNLHGAMFDLTLEMTPKHLLLSFYEGMGFWLRDNIETLERLHQKSYREIVAVGGTNQNPDLQKIKANITGKLIKIPTVPESSATGAALLAAVGCGAYPDFHTAQESLAYPYMHVYPESAFCDQYTDLYQKKYLPYKAALLNAENV